MLRRGETIAGRSKCTRVSFHDPSVRLQTLGVAVSCVCVCVMVPSGIAS